MSITQSPTTKQPHTWQMALQNLITQPEVLLKKLNLCSHQIPVAIDTHFPLRVSESFANKMEVGNPYDPLLLQVLSTKQENTLSDSYGHDPLEERQKNPLPGLLHKFSRRVLMTVTQSCPVHCRFCFRRHFPYQENRITPSHWQKILEYIQNNSAIEEVILSGGDPLMLTDAHLKRLLEDLYSISHLRAIRFHTRMPVMIPERIDPGFLSILANSPKKIVMVYHINHPNEICPQIAKGALSLKEVGCTVLNQGVLLKGINDQVQTLLALCWQLFEANILPYYLHSLDEVAGAAHFAVPLKTALALEQALRALLPGYCMPKFVKEVPHQPAKVAISHLF